MIRVTAKFEFGQLILEIESPNFNSALDTFFESFDSADWDFSSITVEEI